MLQKRKTVERRKRSEEEEEGEEEDGEEKEEEEGEEEGEEGDREEKKKLPPWKKKKKKEILPSLFSLQPPLLPLRSVRPPLFSLSLFFSGFSSSSSSDLEICLSNAAPAEESVQPLNGVEPTLNVRFRP